MRTVGLALCVLLVTATGCDSKKKATHTQPVKPAAAKSPQIKAKTDKTAKTKTGTPAKTNVVKKVVKKAPMLASKTRNDIKPPMGVGQTSPEGVFDLAKAAMTKGDFGAFAALCTPQTARALGRIPPKFKDRIKALYTGKIEGKATINGGRATMKVVNNGQSHHALAYLIRGKYYLDPIKSLRYAPPRQGEINPLNKPVSVAEATKGIAGTGPLKMVMKTSMGNFNCTLFDKKTPKTIANFVGLARSKRGWKDPKSGKWVKKPYYDGLAFHRVIPNFMIQGGDPQGNGRGGPGYTSEDEFDLSLRHTKGGLLSMANAGPNTNGSQFFLTEKATPWLDDNHSIFGECDNIELVKKITGVPTAAGNRPVTPIKIVSLTFSRK